MSDQREYKVMIGGIPHTFLLDSQQARERGLTEQDLIVKRAEKPANKARVPQNKSDK